MLTCSHAHTGTCTYCASWASGWLLIAIYISAGSDWDEMTETEHAHSQMFGSGVHHGWRSCQFCDQSAAATSAHMQTWKQGIWAWLAVWTCYQCVCVQRSTNIGGRITVQETEKEIGKFCEWERQHPIWALEGSLYSSFFKLYIHTLYISQNSSKIPIQMLPYSILNSPLHTFFAEKGLWINWNI